MVNRLRLLCIEAEGSISRRTRATMALGMCRLYLIRKVCHMERYPCNRPGPDNSLVITACILVSSIILPFLLKPKLRSLLFSALKLILIWWKCSRNSKMISFQYPRWKKCSITSRSPPSPSAILKCLPSFPESFRISSLQEIPSCLSI